MKQGEKTKYFATDQHEDVLEIVIYGDITSWEWLDSDVSSYTLSKLITETDAAHIRVRINSYGGEVAEGLAIYNALKNHKAQIATVCDGFACSAASVVFMAGDTRLMNPASLLMIHNAWSSASGNAKELRKKADELELISQTTSNIYKAAVNITDEEVETMLDNETWISPEDAVSKGFATGIIEQPDSTTKQQYAARRTVMSRVLAVSTPHGEKPERVENKTPFQRLFDKFNITGGEEG
nr:MAG TPA: Putative ATP dependent Clp protease [Caudoviricetes sp.]